MKSNGMTLTISTPLQIIHQAGNVLSFRAQDQSGSFGIMPGHRSLLTVLRACVVRWRQAGADWSYCALRGGVMTVEDGRDIRIACREGILGADLSALESGVQSHLEAKAEASRAARLQQARMHAQAIRKIILHMSDTGGSSSDFSLEGVFQ